MLLPLSFPRQGFKTTEHKTINLKLEKQKEILDLTSQVNLGKGQFIYSISIYWGLTVSSVPGGNKEQTVPGLDLTTSWEKYTQS